MPFVNCLTSIRVEAAAEEGFKAGVAKALKEVAGKPESYLFVAMQSGQTFFVRGARLPGVMLEVSLIGALSKAQKKDLSVRLTGLCADALGVAGDAVYIVYREVAGENWACNGDTFA